MVELAYESVVREKTNFGVIDTGKDDGGTGGTKAVPGAFEKKRQKKKKKFF